MMQFTFKAHLALRKRIAADVAELTPEQLNKIPKGFNNNILWNLGHILVVHQLLVYRVAGLPILLDEEFVTLFGKGSKPETTYSADRIEKVKRLLECTVKDLEQDYKTGVFKAYKSYLLQSFQLDLETVEDAIQFLKVHDAIHYGYILALKKAITTKKSLFS